jgi:DNA-binding transcriptional ArsR family regulator
MSDDDERPGGPPDPPVDGDRTPGTETPEDVLVLDPPRLRALAHPLRVRLLGLLRLHGPSTATRLAARVGDSSGSTSYHLRQLAAVGLVAEDPAHAGGGRERWWRAVHSSTRLDTFFTGDDAVVTVEYLRAIAAVYTTKMQEWLAVELDAPAAWRAAATFSDVMVTLPPSAAEELGEAVIELAQEAERRHGSEPGARKVAVQVQVLPQLTVDGGEPA